MKYKLNQIVEYQKVLEFDLCDFKPGVRGAIDEIKDNFYRVVWERADLGCQYFSEKDIDNDFILLDDWEDPKGINLMKERYQ